MRKGIGIISWENSEATCEGCYVASVMSTQSGKSECFRIPGVSRKFYLPKSQLEELPKRHIPDRYQPKDIWYHIHVPLWLADQRGLTNHVSVQFKIV